MVLSLAFTSGAGAAGAAGAWGLSMKICMNSWKKLFGGTIRAGAGAGASGPGEDLRPEGAKPGAGLAVGRLTAGFPWRARGIVERQG